MGDESAVVLEGRLADRAGWEATGCPVSLALTVVGTRSAMLILREAFYGTKRFDDFAERVGITEAVAAARLRELTEAGMLSREPYREPGQRTRHEYHLTDMGRAFFPVVVGLFEWGDTYLSPSPGAPVELRHHGCGERVHVAVTCEQDHVVPLSEVGLQLRSRGRTR